MSAASIFTAHPSILKSISDNQTFPFYKKIQTPIELGISPMGSKIEENVKILKQYDDILISGSAGPMGNKYFVPTGGKCMDVATKNIVPRSLYINNVQAVSAPFAKNVPGEEPTQYKGLIPSVITDINEINPYKLYQAFKMGSTPDCRFIRLETISSNGVKSNEQAGYITDIDLQTMNECWFPNKINPITKTTCKEAFSNIDTNSNMPDDMFMKAYLFALGLVGFYIIMKIVTKKR